MEQKQSETRQWSKSKTMQKALEEMVYEGNHLPHQDKFEASFDRMLNPPGELIQAIPLSLIQPFPDHPFRVEEGEELEQLKQSIRENGVMSPAIVRPLPGGGFQMISGHRRMAACKALGLQRMPAIVREMDDDIATAMTRFYGGNTYAPAVMFDRTHFNTAQPGPVMSVGQVSDIRGYLAQAKAVTTTCKVYTPEVLYNPDTRHLSGAVRGRFGDNSYDSDTRLIVFVIEDSLIGTQSDYNNGTQSAFVHMGTVRAAITDMWGDPLTVDAANDNSFSYTVDYTLPADFVYHNCRIVAIVWHYNPSDINDCPVLNAAQGDYFDRSLGIGEVADGCSLRLFPNPAHGVVTVELTAEQAASACQVDILDLSGRCLLSQSVTGATTHTLGIGHLSAGIYLLRVTTPSGIATRQLLVR